MPKVVRKIKRRLRKPKLTQKYLLQQGPQSPNRSTNKDLLARSARKSEEPKLNHNERTYVQYIPGFHYLAPSVPYIPPNVVTLPQLRKILAKQTLNQRRTGVLTIEDYMFNPESEKLTRIPNEIMKNIYDDN